MDPVRNLTARKELNNVLLVHPGDNGLEEKITCGNSSDFLINLGCDANSVEAAKQEEHHNEIKGNALELLEDLNHVEKIECGICLQGHFENMNFYPGACEHKFCKPCISNYFKEKINTSKVFKIFCPENGCSHVYTDTELQSSGCISDPLWLKYKRFKKFVTQERDLFLRSCTRPGCESFIRSSNPKSQRGFIRRRMKLVCECGNEVCDSCNNDWHSGSACLKLIQGMRSRFCPNCRVPVEKISGCNHMVCERCEHGFCWICLGTYSDWHYKEWNIFGCPLLREGDYSSTRYHKVKLMFRRILSLGLFILKLVLKLIYIICKIIPLIFCLPNIMLFFYTNHPSWKGVVKLMIFFALFLLGIILAPILIVVMIFPPTLIWICGQNYKFLRTYFL